MEGEPLFSFRWRGKAVGVNDRYISRTSKALTPEYAAFMESVRFASCHGTPHRAPLTANVYVYVVMAIDSARDRDSLIKPLFDGMEWDPFTMIGILKNDRQIRAYGAAATNKKRGDMDVIHVTAGEWTVPDDIPINELIELMAQ